MFAGNLRVAQITDTGMRFFHKDHLGSTGAMSREDGTIIDFGEYFPYGSDKSINALLQHSAYKFTDQEQEDEGTGLYNYDARLYDPEIGQFIMADTIVPEPFNPQSLNRYAYCLNNPVRYVDPSGHHYGSGVDGGSVGLSHDGSDAGKSDPGHGGNSNSSGVTVLDDVIVTSPRPTPMSDFGGSEKSYMGDTGIEFATVRTLVDYASYADIAPFGIFPVDGQLLGAFLDFAAAIGTQAVLTADLGTGKIGFGQFSLASALSTLNGIIGQTGNMLGGFGNGVLSAVEFGILELQNKVVSTESKW